MYSVGAVIGPLFAGRRIARYQLSAAVSAPGSANRLTYRSTWSAGRPS